MQHSGTFIHRDGRSYIGGKANYFDYCESSDMNMKALCDMARQIGQNILLKFYCSIVAPKDCNSLVALVIDDDVKCLVKFVDRKFVVGVFTDDFDQLHTMQSQVRSNSLTALSVDVTRNHMEEIDSSKLTLRKFKRRTCSGSDFQFTLLTLYISQLFIIFFNKGITENSQSVMCARSF
ncbi:hypothetical protein ACJIZ3_006069 [Penstemon smallii]|uniref:Uncharacterized protein n=1 Tax=Penstemon smallii TaxID=265156 RepID=A0ABD3S6Q1_9LAMI